ncbi:helix-turn-helix transcriptional regulator [Faecalibaculum rodentium]|uniref:helix-turn-helix transcriptional regulator n=1 Tax=Faecalibaculum rodentium TaxID=1702221 RepID=UPI00338DE2C2
MATNLKTLRERAKITQEELAEMSGVARSTISALEAGHFVNITAKTMKALARALGVSASEIFSGL